MDFHQKMDKAMMGWIRRDGLDQAAVEKTVAFLSEVCEGEELTWD